MKTAIDSTTDEDDRLKKRLNKMLETRLDTDKVRTCLKGFSLRLCVPIHRSDVHHHMLNSTGST